MFIIGPDKKLKLSLNYPASVGRNMDEIVRVVDALQLSAEKSVATPANWPNNHADQGELQCSGGAMLRRCCGLLDGGCVCTLHS